MARLSLNDADKQIRDWFINTAKSLNCETSVDQMGNLFAIRPGKNSSAPPIMMGSHLDTQPTGGRYDGILGVNAGLEVLKVLHENNVETEGSVGVVNWTNEEGARFPMMAVASGVWAEAVPLETAWNLPEVTPGEDGERKTMKQELERIGYLGSQPASYKAMPMACHFEVHIEQGPSLEMERRRVGVVKGTVLRDLLAENATLTKTPHRRSSIQMVRDHGQGTRHARRDNAFPGADGLDAVRGEIDRGIQRRRKETRRPLHHGHPDRRTWLHQHHGPHRHVHAGHPTHGGREAGRDREGVPGGVHADCRERERKGMQSRVEGVGRQPRRRLPRGLYCRCRGEHEGGLPGLAHDRGGWPAVEVYDQRCRPRQLLHQPPVSHEHDLHAHQGRNQPQSSRVLQSRRLVSRSDMC